MPRWDRGKRYPASAQGRRRGSHKGGFTTTVRANQAVTVAAANLTEMFSNNGLLPNCMVTLRKLTQAYPEKRYDKPRIMP